MSLKYRTKNRLKLLAASLFLGSIVGVHFGFKSFILSSIGFFVILGIINIIGIIRVYRGINMR